MSSVVISCMTSPSAMIAEARDRISRTAQRAVLHHQLEGPAEQEIADQDRRLVAPQRVRGVAAAPQVAGIDDIVMQQGRGVDEFDRGGERDMAVAAIAAQPGAAQGQHRPQPLAAAGDDMTGELRDQPDRAVHAIDDQPVDLFEVALQQPRQRVERRLEARTHPIDTRLQRHPVLLRVQRAGRPAARSA